MRWFKALGGLLLITLLAGCIKIEGTIVVDDDGSGSVNLLQALDGDSVLRVLADFDIPEAELGGVDDLCDEFGSDSTDTSQFPVDAQYSDYDEQGFCGQRVTFDLSPSSDHSAAIGGVFEGENARLFKDGENWFFEADLDLEELNSESEGLPPDMADALFGDASIKFTVDLPGRAIEGENNATSVGSDGRFEWDIDFSNPPARLFAQTEPGSGGGSGGGLAPILIVAAVLSLAAAGAWWFLSQRKSADSLSPPPSEPAYDESLNAWVIDDPVQGKLVHDAATDTWKPFPAG